MKRFAQVLLAAVFLLSGIPAVAVARSADAIQNGGIEEYEEFIRSPETIPVRFRIGDRGYRGFGKDFTPTGILHETEGGKREDTLTFRHISGLDVEVRLAAYPDCDAYEWTVYFHNGTTGVSPVIRDISVADIVFEGENPRLKGIYGDVSGGYAAYDFDLNEAPVVFDSTSGRPSDGVFPYYNLEYGDGGVLMAIGWPGTWRAEFTVEEEGKTHYRATANTGFASYLMPGETVRTALAVFVKYDVRDEDYATNRWRDFYIRYNMPTERDGSRLKPIRTLATFNDYTVTGAIGHDVSPYETTETMLSGLETAYAHGVEFEYYWVDAGWYTLIDGSSILSSSIWRTIGTWEVDRKKFPNTLKEVDDFLEAHNDKFLLWYEPEWNLLHDNVRFENNTGFRTAWFLPGGGSSAIQLVNLANEDCYEWMYDKISSSIRENGVDYYREDFNNDPAPAWSYGDWLEGKNRTGITENLYVQNHLRMWRELKEEFPKLLIDSCSSGGRRNDLESMRLAVPLHRTDMDYNSPNMRLSMSGNLFKWLPYFGSPAFLSNTPDVVSKYLMRAAYTGDIKLTLAWSSMSEQTYETLFECLDEYDIVKGYLYSDYYLLTKSVAVDETNAWTAWEFFEPSSDSGIVEVFRRNGSTEPSQLIRMKGVDDDRFYTLYDFDGAQSVERISGKALKEGVTVRLGQEESALFRILPAD